MSLENRRRLADRVAKAAEASLAAQNYVSPVDVLVGIGWLEPGAVKRWRQGQVDYLERVVQTNLSRISEAMKLFRSWATAKGLIPSETSYVARTPSRQTLRFSKSGSPTIEQLYRTHWLFGRAFSEKAGALGREGEPCTGTGGDSPIERRMDMPPVRWHRCDRAGSISHRN